MVKAINVWYLNFQEKGMVSVNKWKSLRFHSLHTRKSFQNFGCLTKQYCVKWILSRFSLNGYIFHMVFKGAKQIRCGSTNLPIFGTWICNECVIKEYGTISSYLTVPKGLIKNLRRNYLLFLLETESSKF